VKSAARALLLLFAAFAVQAADVPKPAIVIDKRDTTCVAPPAEMRRQHMEMLRHQRDRTLRQGERGARVSLNGCVDCHASSKTGAVVGSKEDFCEGCHAYVAVKLDCFECHQGKTGNRAMKVSER
jgi:hypothetical protein